MGKREVESEIGIAYEAIKAKDVKIADDSERVQKAYRSQISSFGAAVVTSGLRSAVAFYSQKGAASVDRTKLLKAILYVLKNSAHGKLYSHYDSLNDVLDDAKTRPQKIRVRNDVIDAATAIKLAFNLYELVGAAVDDSDGE